MKENLEKLLIVLQYILMLEMIFINIITNIKKININNLHHINSENKSEVNSYFVIIQHNIKTDLFVLTMCVTNLTNMSHICINLCKQ